MLDQCELQSDNLVALCNFEVKQKPEYKTVEKHVEARFEGWESEAESA